MNVLVFSWFIWEKIITNVKILPQMFASLIGVCSDRKLFLHLMNYA